MKIPPADMAYIAQRFHELADRLDASLDDRAAAESSGTTPANARDAMRRLAILLQDPNSGDNPGGSERELQTLGDFGIHLIEELADLATAAELHEVADEIRLLSFPLAVWIGRQGAEITQLGPVVNAAAFLANQVRDPIAMAELYTCLCLVIEAVAPRLTGAEADNDPANPWRLLLLNRAIVATRSHRAELMEPALDAVVELLPETAARFLEEGMDQMAQIPYPEHVREIMRRYYLAHASQRTLH